MLLMRRLLVSAAILMVCLPASFFLSIEAYPFWSWVEERYGIEAVGHSGPAEWCYVAAFIALAVLTPFGSACFESACFDSACLDSPCLDAVSIGSFPFDSVDTGAGI